MTLTGPIDIDLEIQELINSTLRAQRFFWFYPDQHPACEQVIKTVKVHFDRLILEGPVIFNVTRNTLSLGALPLDTHKRTNMEFCRMLYKRRIQSMTLERELDFRELGQIVRILSLDPKRIRQKGGINNLLKELNVIHVHVAEYYFDTSEDTRSGGQNEGPDLLAGITEEQIERFKAFLRGDIRELTSDEEEVFLEYIQNGDRTFELIQQAVHKPESTVANIQYEREIRKALDRLRKWLDKYPPEIKFRELRRIGLVLLKQSRDFRAGVFTSPSGLDPDEQKTIHDIFESVPDDDIVKSLVKDITESDMPDDVKSIISRLYLEPVREAQIIEKFNQMLHQRATQMDESKRMEGFRERLAEYTRPRIMGDCVDILLELLERETEPTPRLNLLRSFENALPEMVSCQQIAAADEIVLVLADIATGKMKVDTAAVEAAQKILERLSSGVFMDEVKKQLQEPKPGQEDVLIQLLGRLGGNAVTRLIQTVSESDNPKEYEKYCVMIQRIGPSIIPELINQLAKTTGVHGKKWLTILGNIQHEEVAHQIRRSFSLIPDEFKAQTIILAGNYPVKENQKWLMELWEKNGTYEIRMPILEALGKMGDPESVEFIMSLASRSYISGDRGQGLQIKAIQLLGKLDQPIVVPVLEKILLKWSLVNSKSKNQLRMSAAQSLSKMTVPSAKDVIDKGLKDYRKSIRRICENIQAFETKGENN